MMSADMTIRIAVVGAGYFGTFHAEKLARMPGAELVAVVDIDGERAQRLAQKHSARAHTDYRELVGEVDAVTVAVQTQLLCKPATITRSRHSSWTTAFMSSWKNQSPAIWTMPTI
jgi:predicted homoserine dehydrogenase-like protein